MDTDPLDQALALVERRRRLPPPKMRRLVRETAGLTQTDLARALDVDRATVSRWESGDRFPAPAVLARYLEALDRLARAHGSQ